MKETSRALKAGLTKAAHECFSHEMGGTLAPYLYSDPEGENDKDCGAYLWDKLTRTQGSDYYLANDEPKFIEQVAAQIIAITGSKRKILEFAPGSASKKARPFIEASQNTQIYVPIDIAAEFANSAGQSVQQYKPEILVAPIVRDFIAYKSEQPETGEAIGLCFGSTVSNMRGNVFNGMPRKPLKEMLENIRSYLPPGGYLVITQDTNQDETSILKSYGHKANSRFALNVLNRIRRDLDTENFNPKAFTYRRNWIPERSLLAHFAVSTRPQRFTIEGREFSVNEGETFNIINSYKYTTDFFKSVAESARYKHIDVLWDNRGRIAMHILRAEGDIEEPIVNISAARRPQPVTI